YPDRLGGPVCAAAAGERGGAHRGGEQAAPEAERSLDEDGVRGGGGASGILQGTDELLPARGGGVRAELRERSAGRRRGRRARRLRTLPGLGSGTGFGGGGGGDQAGAEHRAQGELERDGQRWGFPGGAGGEGAAAGGGGADGRRRVRGGASCDCELAAPMEQFFHEVRVNDPDPKLRAARLSLLGATVQRLSRIADFAEL